MNDALAALLRSAGGLVTRVAALRVVPDHVVRHAVRAGHVRAMYAGVLVAADLADARTTRWRAALLRAGPNTALSHLSALDVWGLPVPHRDQVHLTADPDGRLRVAGLIVHRRAGFRAEPPDVVHRRGLPITRLERSLIDSWPLLVGDAQRGPLLAAVGRRLTTSSRLLAALRAASPRLPGRPALRHLLERIAAGCRSELELWGYDHVFVGPGMPPLDRQVPVTVRGRTIYLDLVHRPTATNFELDGAKWHDGLSQRERDLRRDAALATLGIQAIRFTHDRLTLEPDAVRREVLAILAHRPTIIGQKW